MEFLFSKFFSPSLINCLINQKILNIYTKNKKCLFFMSAKTKDEKKKFFQHIKILHGCSSKLDFGAIFSKNGLKNMPPVSLNELSFSISIQD